MFYFLTYPFFFTVLRILARMMGHVRSSGESNVPASGGFMYCPNHISDSDPCVLLTVFPRRSWMVGKTELFAIPVLGWIFDRFQSFPIRRNSPDRAALRKAESVLLSGNPLMIFPEGHISPDATLQRLHPGAALLALRTGVPLVPVGLKHTNELVPYREQMPRFTKHPIEVAFGKPIDPADYAHLKQNEAIYAMTERLGEEIARLIDQPAPEKPLRPRRGRNGHPFDGELNPKRGESLDPAAP